jgi:PAS domain S-box-containing protein
MTMETIAGEPGHPGPSPLPQRQAGARPFRLSRYFSIVSVIGIGVVIAIMFLLSNQSITRTLVTQESAQNVALARTMLNALWPRYAPLARRAHQIPPADLVDQIENVQLRSDIYRLTRQLNIVKVRIFSIDRRIIFSNWDNEIGEHRPNDRALENALAGSPQSALSFKPGFESIDGTRRDRHVVETYMAIDHPETAVREGAIELYTDISADIALVREEQLRIALVLGICMLALYIFLLLAVMRAENIMTEQQQALTDSQHRARMLARVVEQSRDSIVTRDLNGIITTWNRGAETIFGYSAEEAVGRSMRDIILKNATDEEWQAWLTRLRSGNTLMIRGWRPTKSGGRVHIVGSSGPLTDDAGQLVGDTTWLERAQDELRRAKDAAEAAAHAKSAFLANMSHEIRTPMNGIIGMTNLALDTALNAEQRDYLTTVKSSADALLEIINDILDLSKIEAGKLSMEHIEFSLRDSLQQTVRVLAVRAHEKRLELIWSVDAAVPDALIGDPLRIRQIVLNLVGNAIKFTAEGEVEIQVRIEDVRDREVQLRFRVRDTGIGIPHDKCDAIFEAFEQADTSTTRQFGGTGLGLSICRRLVHMMGGEISVHSAEGAGSTFEFSLRLAMQEMGAQTGSHGLHSPSEAFVGQPALVVDDNARCRDLLCAYLDSWGMRPEACASASAALARIATARAAGKPFRLVLIDGTLPDADAFALAAKTVCDATAAVVLADTTQGPAIANARAQAGVHALIKPVSQSTLHDAVAILLDPAMPQAARTAPATIARSGTAPAARSLDILLVEDNAVNRKLATRMLEKMGHCVTEAHDGAAAVTANAAHIYDVILMDMQMPVMDGLDATRAIRAHENGVRRVPIIALTANAMGGDRDRCIEAGMDDYVSKPIEASALIAALDRVTAPPDIDERTPVPAADGAGPDTMQPPYDRAAALERAAGDAELLAQIIEIYLQETPALLEQLGAFLDAGDAQQAFRSAHTIKGSSANLSAGEVTDAARAVELAARLGDLAAARAAYPRLQSATTLLIERLIAGHDGTHAACLACEETS